MLLLLALLAHAESVAPLRCAGITPQVLVLGPGPGESNVPLDTRVWVRLTGAPPDQLRVTLSELDGTGVLEGESRVLYSVVDPHGATPIEAGLEILFRDLLAPNSRYSLTWSATTSRGLITGGHVFVTGLTRDDEPPGEPLTTRADAVSSPVDCDSAIGLDLTLGGFDTESNLHLAELDGVVRGLGRGTHLFAYVGAPMATAVGAVTAIDLAGNRSREARTFSGVTGSRTFEPAQPESCAAVGPSSGLVALLAALAISSVRRAAGASAR